MSCACRFRGTARSCSCVLPTQRPGRLRAVGMLGTGVDLQLRDLLPGEPIFGEHALHCLAQDLLRATVELLAQRAAAQPAGITGMAVVALLVELVPSDLDLLRVDDDDEIAGVDVRRVRSLAFAAERVGNAGRQATERLALGIDDVPVAGDLARLCAIGLHSVKRRPLRGVRRRRIVAALPGIPRLRRGLDAGYTALRWPPRGGRP